jgi:hypothetical protein
MAQDDAVQRNPTRSEVFRRYRELEQVQEKVDAMERLLARGQFVPSDDHDQREFGELMEWVRDARARDEKDKAAHQKAVARRTAVFTSLGGMIAAAAIALFLPDWWQALKRGWQAIVRLIS